MHEEVTAERVASIDWDESHVDVPDLDLVLPHNAADLDDDARVRRRVQAHEVEDQRIEQLSLT